MSFGRPQAREKNKVQPINKFQKESYVPHKESPGLMNIFFSGAFIKWRSSRTVEKKTKGNVYERRQSIRLQSEE